VLRPRTDSTTLVRGPHALHHYQPIDLTQGDVFLVEQQTYRGNHRPLLRPVLPRVNHLPQATSESGFCDLTFHRRPR